jgi:hypothetical protein
MTSPITIFNQLAVSFNGVGTSIRLLPSNYDSLLQVQNLSTSTFNYVRIRTGVTDPGFAFQGLSDAATDALWAAESTPFQAIIDYLASINIKIILTIEPPSSWLTTGSLTGSLALSSFATLVVSGYKFFNDFQANIVHSVSLFDEPDVSPIIYPIDLISLSTLTKNVAISRSILDLKLIGHSLSQVSPETNGVTNQSNVFRLAMIGSPNTFDYWDIHGVENSADSVIYNGQDFEARSYMQERFRSDRVEFESINFPLEKIVSRMITRATFFPNTVGDQGTNSSNLVDYALRLAENFVAALKNRFGIVLFGQLTKEGSDEDTILDVGNIYRPFYTLVQLLSTKLPTQGWVFEEEELDNNDTTIKALVLATNSMSFGLVMCRPISDPFSGKLTITVNNPIWTPALEFTNFVFEVYPFTTDISTTEVSFSELYEGSATLRLINVPYNCVLFLTGDLTIIPPPTPPVIVPTVYLQETIIQVPIYYGIPAATPVPGTIYYDTQANLTKVYDTVSGWITITPLPPP